MPLLDQRTVDQPHHRHAAPVGDPEPRPIRERGLGAASDRPAAACRPRHGEPVDELMPDGARAGRRLDHERQVNLAGDPVFDPTVRTRGDAR